MRFRLASILSQYIGDQRIVKIDEVSTLHEALDALDRKFPGIKFRFVDEMNQIRPHMNIFVNNELVRKLNVTLSSEDEVFIVQSISGG